MDKNAVLGELLYIISNYEKGRIKTTGIWSKKYKNSLKKSLEIMQLLIYFLKTNKNITVEEMQPIFDYYKQNTYKIFPQSTIDFDDYISNDAKIFLNTVYTDKNASLRVVEYMESMIKKCDMLLDDKEKQYKVKISSLIKAFHNLPKVYLNPTAQTLFNIGIKPISEDEAIDYAESYISKKL